LISKGWWRLPDLRGVVIQADQIVFKAKDGGSVIMLYLRICFDKPGMGAMRNELRMQHREYLKPYLEPGRPVRILQAGPMCMSDTDDTNLGSFLILEADSLAAVEQFHTGDPFTTAGIYGDVRLVRWDRHIQNA
jgi:uncharacterized protein